MEINPVERNPAYTKLVRVIKTHGRTREGLPTGGDTECPKVGEALTCPSIHWSEPAGLVGKLKLAAYPVEKSLGLIELTMQAGIPDKLSPLVVKFKITEREVRANMQKYDEFYGWSDSDDEAPGSKYLEQLMKTADVIEERFSKDETQKNI